MSDNKKTIELWEGYEVEVKEQLLDDFNFTRDLAEAQKNDDLQMFVGMLFEVIGGEKTYDAVEKHITEEKGYFSQEELLKILEKVGDAFPKAGNRAQKHSWQTSK